MRTRQILGRCLWLKARQNLADEFKAENVTMTFSATGDGKLKVEVEPKSAAGQFFIRVKITP